jgi:hypothetical protein
VKPIVEEYWDGVVRRLQAEVDIFNRLIGHAGEQGRENELSLARLLENLVPRRLGIGSGIVIDSTGQRSQQTDIVIYDLADQPTVMAQTNQVIFPVEVVYAVVEVKTVLRAADLVDFASKKRSMDKLTSQFSTGPESLLLSYEAWAKPITVAEHIYDMDSSTRPDGLCVINPGILAGTPAGLSDGTGFRVGLAPLHERDGEGSRIIGNWRSMKSLPKGGVSIFEGTSYPVTRGPGRGWWLVGEPGRALLLFCEALLRSLALRKGLPKPAWSAYLGDTARDLLVLEPKL